MPARAAPFAFLLLTACAWPDIPNTDTADAADWPVLQPFDLIGAPSVDPEREAANEEIQTRADDLRTRAETLRQPLTDDDAMERLRQSLAR